MNETLEYFEALQRIADIEELVEREKKVDMLKWNGWKMNPSSTILLSSVFLYF